MADNILSKDRADADIALAAKDVGGVLFPRNVLVTPAGVDLSPLTDAELRATALQVSGTVTVSNPTPTGLTDAELRATSLPVTVEGAAQDTTLQALRELNDTMLYMLSAILEKMPRVTGNDQAAISIEAGAVSFNANQTVGTVTTLGNITSIGSKTVATMPDAISQLGALHLYQNITVS